MSKRFIRYGMFATFAAALATGGVAYAQPADDMGGEGESMDESMDETMGEDPALGEDPAAEEGASEMDPLAAESAAEAESAGDVVMGAWPQEIVQRPLTLPKGAFEAGFELFADSSFDVVANAASPLEQPFLFGAAPGGFTFSYGIDDKLEVGASYSMVLQPEFEAKGALLAHGAYNVLRDGKLDVTVQGALGYDVFAEGLAPISAGAEVKYMLNDKMAVLTPGNQLVITLDGVEILGTEIKPSFFQLPVGFGFQATPEVYLEGMTRLGVIEISDVESGFIFSDFIVLQAQAFYAVNNTMDIGVGAATDFKADDIGDATLFLASFRYYGGV